ncbi:PSD1 and planctomycete cytochrome C domain-containing protein [Planctomycetes bacterium K23_9]|uniref:Planctomycete cytochrome C n=1 Tax=Stieleria marina TaxID=1930275 RepID=A0A517NN04_9BACT|nr:Planctomycete cytochrome C [Planctomycetes bacterium K23_9]
MNRFLTSLAIFLAVSATVSADPLTAEQSKFFETKIRPVLIKECYGCHSSKAGNARGGLQLDNQRSTHVGGDSGAAIVPGDLEQSLLFNAITHEDFVMPPKRKLSDSVIDDFRKWILMGAPDPRVTEIAEIQSTITDDDIAKSKSTFWAYQNPVLPTVPGVNSADWTRTPIDHFLLSELEKAEVSPNQDAQSYKVLRRLCFDLVGLPPSPEQIDYFQTKWSADPDAAIALVVDRLLDKPQFGERWGRHWLDVARYAESTGREVNLTYPHAWRYRDYVIDSFNEDKPFDRFVQEQIAGDLLPVNDDEQWTQNLIATGFLAIGTKNVNENNGRQFAADNVDEQIDTTTRVFLGTSVACARCHDHKFDAIPQTDYYALAGIFGSTRTYFGNPPSEFGSLSDAQTKRSSSLILLPIDDPSPFDKKLSKAEMDDMREQISEMGRQIGEARRNRNNPGKSGSALTSLVRLSSQRAKLSSQLAVVDDDGNPRSYCMGVQDSDSVADARVLVRGEIDELGQVIRRGFPQVLTNDQPSIPARKSGRLELARWIGSDQNTLTARVMVNRVWQHLMGQGIVTSTENFGVTGQSPSHPELLDYLAVRFVDSGWSVKTLIREIATSRAYRISSDFDESKFNFDPDNALLWRANPRRLDAEALRDAMLAVSGELVTDRPRGSAVAKAGYMRVRDGRLSDPREQIRQVTEKMRPEIRDVLRQRIGQGRGGMRPDTESGRRPGSSTGRQRPSFRERMGRSGRSGFGNRPSLAEATAARNSITKLINQRELDAEDATYRSVYLPIVRDEVPRSLDVFDFAESTMVVGTRESSNTPNQALYMMNNAFVIQQSDAFANRLARTNGSLNDKIEQAFVLTYGRPPTRGERSATARFVGSMGRSSESKKLALLCQSLFASAEFRYLD